jgi:hypothetical protein
VPPYAADLNRHLAAYKATRLGVRQAGIFRHRGREVRHEHILPRELQWLNILEAYRSEVRQYLHQNTEVRRHRYFHHLNSSQAFTFNLFFPFFSSNCSRVLLTAMQLPGEAAAWRLEHVADPTEGTNVDVAWQGGEPGCPWTYCEVKLSETDFGTARNDATHRDKLDRTYGPALAHYVNAELLEATQFFMNYQLMRNLWLAALKPTSSVVFLLPRRNQRLWDRLQAITDNTAPALAKRIRVAATEDVLDRLAAQEDTPPHLALYAKQLAEKYIVF